MSEHDRVSAARLRREFDEAFARPLAIELETREQLLAIRANDRALALRHADAAGIMRCPRLTALPSRNPALCGLAGVRGALVAVYSIAALLRQGPPPRLGWIVTCRDDRSAALLFDELDGYASVLARDIHPVSSPDLAAMSAGLVSVEGVQRTLLSMPALLEAIRRTPHTITE